MSDTVPNPDIEDVLSSIRRLVSHDGDRAAKDTADEGDASAPQPKLVLTPALRIEADDEAAAPDVEPTDDALFADTEASDLMSPDVPLAFTSARAAREKADAAEHHEDQDTQDDAKGPALVLEDPVALSEDPTPATLSEEGVLRPEVDATSSVEDAPSEPAMDPIGKHESLTAKIAALEEVIGREPDQWEPESEGLGENAGTDVDALPWEDHVDDSAEDADAVQDVVDAATDDHPATQDDPDADPDLADLGETILDEAMLRDLVSNIVREELQGALGERITRNVRKLVRREIHRAMSAQDFN